MVDEDGLCRDAMEWVNGGRDVMRRMSGMRQGLRMYSSKDCENPKRGIETNLLRT